MPEIRIPTYVYRETDKIVQHFRKVLDDHIEQNALKRSGGQEEEVISYTLEDVAKALDQLKQEGKAPVSLEIIDSDISQKLSREVVVTALDLWCSLLSKVYPSGHTLEYAANRQWRKCDELRREIASGVLP